MYNICERKTFQQKGLCFDTFAFFACSSCILGHVQGVRSSAGQVVSNGICMLMMMSGSENTELVFTKFQNASHTHCFRPREVFIEKATVENGQKKNLFQLFIQFFSNNGFNYGIMVYFQEFKITLDFSLVQKAERSKEGSECDVVRLYSCVRTRAVYVKESLLQSK